MLGVDRNDDLASMYKLVSRVPQGLFQLKYLFESHVHAQGLAAVEKCKDNAMNDPKVYVTALLDVHLKYSTWVQESFSSDQAFTMALDKACGSVSVNVPF